MQPTIIENLKKNGLKVTPQRLAIYSMLCTTDKHPSVETIYRALTPVFPSMSLATVYKTLDALVEAGLIQEINVGENSFRYDANPESHPHIVCTCCYNVFDLPKLDSLATLKKELEERTEFIITNEKLYFYGTCSKCR